MKTPIRKTKVYKTPFITKPRLLGKDWEHYIAHVTAW